MTRAFGFSSVEFDRTHIEGVPNGDLLVGNKDQEDILDFLYWA